MPDSDEVHLKCVHLVHTKGERGRFLPGGFCSCPAGLVHIDDCPVSIGLSCIHFQERESDPVLLDERAYEAQHAELMTHFLQRAYRHRIRSLSPEGDPWDRRRERHLEDYARADLPEEPSDDGSSDEAYEAEKAGLIAERKRREEERERREKRAAMDARERARHGIKTVVERARETVAAQGNVATSYLDEIELPKTARKKRRRRRPGGGKGRGGGGDAPRPQGAGTDVGKHRARPTGEGGGAPRPGGPGEKSPVRGEGGRPRRRRRRRGKGGPKKPPAGT